MRDVAVDLKTHEDTIWLNDIDEARATAGREGRMVICFLHALTCGGCQRLKKVTFPDPAVRALIRERFVPLQIDVRDESNKSLVASLRQVWTPDFRMLAPDGSDFFQWNGFLPPGEFVPQALVGEGRAWLRLGEFQKAADVYRLVTETYPTSAAAPEGAYYLAVSLMKLHKDRTYLNAGFQRLRESYPGSIWRQKASYVEPDVPTGPGSA